MTSIAEFDNGKRHTKKGNDRFTNTLIPVLGESATSMYQSGFDVDVFLICHYPVSTERYRQVLAALPSHESGNANTVEVGLTVWDEATPIGYAVEHSTRSIMNVTRGLARQHRYVIKDKLLHYDMFVAYEDDMVVHGAQVQQYRNVSDALYRLRQAAPSRLDNTYTIAEMNRQFHGPMTATQLSRMIPGWIRVEVALDGWKPKRTLELPIPRDFRWDETGEEVSLDPSICCQIGVTSSNAHMPSAPHIEDLYFWETTIDALHLRKMPEIPFSQLDWVVLQAGNTEDWYEDTKFIVGRYWSGTDGYFGHQQDPPDSTLSHYINNQGGWMATRRQLHEWHSRWCLGGFLPPYDPPKFHFDGLDSRSVEYWSGGIQIVGVKACNLQRIIPLQPQIFARHLQYHASNNKQRQRTVQARSAFTKIQDLWGQLNTVRKNAEQAIRKERDEFGQ